MQQINRISSNWKGSANQIKEFKTSFVARVGDDPENASDRVLRRQRGPDGKFKHSQEQEKEHHSTKRMDERMILARYIFIICSLETCMFLNLRKKRFNSISASLIAKKADHQGKQKPSSKF